MFDVSKKLRSGKAQALFHKLVGGFATAVFMICWCIFLINLLLGTGNIIVVIVFFLLIGFAKMHYDKGVALKDLIDRYESYVFLLSERHTITVEELAFITGQEPEAVQKGISEMVKKRYIYKLDVSRNGRAVAYIQHTAIELMDDITKKKKKRVSVKCESCGAVSKVPVGESGACEYCGTNIHA